MKKSLLLGAAAFAAMAYVGTADAGEIKTGGYYMFRVLSTDATITTENDQSDDTRNWTHRLQLKTDFKASEKTHAHTVIRVLSSDVVAAADVNAANNTASTTGVTAVTSNTWQINQAWLETEAWGIGLKVGEMPISMNDKILINNKADETSFGTIMLSKTFGDITAIAANVRVIEGRVNGTDTTGVFGADEDDVDLYVMSLLGGMEGVNYQLTGAFLNVRDTPLFAGSDTDNGWVAGTVGGDANGINWTGTLIYEAGYDNDNNNGDDQYSDDGMLAALRVKGKAGFGGWNGYAFWAGKNFNNITAQNPGWSQTWDAGGPGAPDLMGRHGFASANGSSISGTTDNSTTAANISDTENMLGLGFGLTIETSGWTINPMLDFAAIDEEDIDNDSVSDFRADSAWGGSLLLSTSIDKDTKLTLTGTWIDPDATDTFDAENMYNASVDVKMLF